MEEKIIEFLKSIGFTKNESLVYLDLVSNKTSSATRVSLRTKLHRANVYDSLNALIKKGFVSEIIKEDKKSFRALELSKIKDYLNQKESELKDIIPLIKSMISIETIEKEEVVLLKGVFSVKNFLIGSLEYSKSIEMYGVSKEFLDSLGEGFLNEFNRVRVKKKVPLRIILKKKIEESSQFRQIPYTEVRASNIDYASLAVFTLLEEEVMMVIPVKPFSIINIKSREIAQSYKEYFNVLWKNSKAL